MLNVACFLTQFYVEISEDSKSVVMVRDVPFHATAALAVSDMHGSHTKQNQFVALKV